MGIGSFYNQQAQQAQDVVAPPGTGGAKPAPGSNPYVTEDGNTYNPYQNYGSHSVAYPGQSPQDWLAMQRGESIYNVPGQQGGYRAWPGGGMGGMPGRFAGAYNPMGGFAGGGMSNYGFGSSPFGYGGFSPWGYGPGSYSPYGAGMMGYGGGSGMMGGPGRPFTGFNYNNLAQQLAGGPFPESYGNQQAAQGGFGWQPGVTPAHLQQIKQLQKQIRRLQQAQNPGGDGGRSCFVEGTLVQLENGRRVPIEQIRVGDKLLGNASANTVLEYDRPTLGTRLLYSINGGKHFVTSEHPFYTPEGWKSFDPAATAEENPDLEVETLRLGDMIWTDDGRWIEVEKIGTTTEHPGTQLYNFKLDGDNTYYADGYLVHNKQGDGPGGNGPGPGPGGPSGGCFAKGTKFKMADGSWKAVEDMEIGDLTEFGAVTDVMRGKSDRQWFDYLGTEVTDEHFVLEDGEWKYVKDSDGALLIDPHDTYYTLNTEQHLLCGVNDVIFSDDAVFDTDHKPEWDEMLRRLNGSTRATA